MILMTGKLDQKSMNWILQTILLLWYIECGLLTVCWSVGMKDPCGASIMLLKMSFRLKMHMS
jgi:hypothetical protein